MRWDSTDDLGKAQGISRISPCGQPKSGHPCRSPMLGGHGKYAPCARRKPEGISPMQLLCMQSQTLCMAEEHLTHLAIPCKPNPCA